MAKLILLTNSTTKEEFMINADKIISVSDNVTGDLGKSIIAYENGSNVGTVRVEETKKDIQELIS